MTSRAASTSLTKLYIGSILLGCLGFTLLASGVTAGSTSNFDTTIADAIHSLHQPWLDTFFTLFTSLGNLEVMLPLSLGILALLLIKKQYRNAAVLTFGVGGAALLNVLLKNLFDRDRPDLWVSLVHETSYSFPSGHAMASCALALCIIAFVWKTKWRTVVLVCGISFMALIGISRVYVGVHYPTDVLGGWILGGTWVALVVLVSLRVHQFRYLHPHSTKT